MSYIERETQKFNMLVREDSYKFLTANFDSQFVQFLADFGIDDFGQKIQDSELCSFNIESNFIPKNNSATKDSFSYADYMFKKLRFSSIVNNSLSDSSETTHYFQKYNFKINQCLNSYTKN
jgi:hypothetical protein